MNVKTKNLTKIRLISVMLLFSFFGLILLNNIFRLSYLNYDYYKDRAFDQITTSSVLKANRGCIYDSQMNLIAKSDTSWRIFVTPKDIKKADKSQNRDHARIIANGLSKILTMDEERLYEKIKSAKTLDVTIKRNATEDEYLKALEFINKEGLNDLIHLEAVSSRSYPLNSFAAHTVGFTGSDNQGLYGLEYYYDDILSGTDGYYLYAKDAGGRELDTEYADYIPPEDGYSIVTTLDSYIQSELEAVIEAARVNHSANNRVTGIVMDSTTGAILAMATTTPFDPNNPFELDSESQRKLNESGLINGTDEYKAYKNELLQIMWSNKAVSETYEPGSTFKIITVSAALDLGVATTESTFSCKGYHKIGGWTIKCHKTTGHGTGFNLAYGLQMSCNPCMMNLAERIGAENFYDYVEKFGYFEKSGIDLPSEASTIFHKEENIGPTELATASFGQRFKVSIINHLTAVSAVANGGRLVTPYLVEKIIDKEGNVVSVHEPEIRRVVVKEEIADTVSQILIDGVNGDGGAKNAGVSGYNIAAKTGTSQKFDVLDENGNSYLRIGSTVAYSIDGDRGISAIIVVDEPTSSVKYGSVVAAPYISSLMEKILPYLDYKSSAEDVEILVDNYVGLRIDAAKEKLDRLKIPYEIVGDGRTVISQAPENGQVVTCALSKIILYTENTNTVDIKVPNLLGLPLSDAIKTALKAGLNIKLAGNGATLPDANDIVSEQSLPPNMITKRGSVIIIRSIEKNFED